METVAQSFRKLRYGSLSKLPDPVYTLAKKIAVLSLYFISLGQGRKVKVAGIYPLQVEWERSAVDFNTWEAEFIKEFGKALREPKIVFDIGASIGEWSALASILVGSKNVHCFEPNLASWKHIEKVFRLNKLAPPAGILPGFAGNLDSFDNDVLVTASAYEWLKRVEGTAEFETLSEPKNLPCIKIDTYCEAKGVIPDVIKIDVEGAEGEVLRGSQNILEQFHPLIFLSLHPWALKDFGDSKTDILNWIEQQGYTCSLLATDHEEHWLCSPKN